MDRERLVSIVGSLATALVCILVGSAQEPLQAAVGDTSCVYTFSSGANSSSFIWCLSSNGNIMRLESPVGVINEHIRVGVFTEGYAVCSVYGMAYDYGSSASGFEPTTVVSGCVGGGLPCTLQRDTTDGNFRLKMVFIRNGAEREILITETLTNLGPSASNVALLRFGDADMNNTVGDDWGDRSLASSWARDLGPNERLGLSALTHGILHPTSVTGPAPPIDPLCVTGDNGPLPEYGDVGILVKYDIGVLGALKVKTVKFQYRVD